MCVDPRRLVRAAAALVSGMLVVGAVACGGSQPQQQAAAPAPVGPMVLSPAERAAWYQACWAHFNSKAWDPFKACYADAAESDRVDGGQAIAKNAEEIVAGVKASTAAFPDMKGANQLILVKGDTLVGISLITGTHTGPLVRSGSPSVPATGKPIGVLEGHVIQVDETGSKVVKEQFYMDSGTMLAQLGLSPAPARPVMSSTAAPPAVVIAAGTPAELSNVASMRAQIAASNSHDAKAIDAFNASDFVYHDMTMPADQTAKESLASTQEFFKAFPDAKSVPFSVWAAGNYVVVTGRFEGTNKGPMAAMGLKRATNKAVSARYLDITRWESGKIKEEWLFYNGMAVAGQLGLGKK